MLPGRCGLRLHVSPASFRGISYRFLGLTVPLIRRLPVPVPGLMGQLEFPVNDNYFDSTCRRCTDPDQQG